MEKSNKITNDIVKISVIDFGINNCIQRQL